MLPFDNSMFFSFNEKSVVEYKNRGTFVVVSKGLHLRGKGCFQELSVIPIRSRPDRDFRNRTGPDRIGTPDPVDRTGPDRIPDQDIDFF